MARLVVELADGSERDIPLSDRPALVGRDQAADIHLAEPLISRAHARIERRGEEFFVVDLGSTNLTRVNGEVVGERQLQHGDELRFGRTRCRFLGDQEDHSGPGSGLAK